MNSIITTIILSLVTLVLAQEELDEYYKNCSEPIYLSHIQNRFDNGANAAEGQFPYQVGLDFPKWYCSGALISSKFVVTLAYCTDSANFVKVLLGGIDWDMPEISYVVKRNNFIQHEKYERGSYHYDISLIKIPETQFSPNIQTVDFPIMPNNYPLYISENLTVSGWGKTTNDKNANQLKYAVLKVYSNGVCGAPFPFILEEENCAFSDQIIGADSGSPMVLSGTKTLIGLSSYGCNCGQPFPTVFTRIASYINWIKKNTGIIF